MNQSKHNPDYKLVSVTMDNKEFVYGEKNYTGDNSGLEVYHYKPNADHFHYSRRYKANTTPVKYWLVINKLRRLIFNCKAGYKLTITEQEFKSL